MAAENAETQKSKALRILIADDFPVIREAVSAMLGGEPGWEICGFASDGDEAVQKAVALMPDVIVLDVRMPGLDSVEVVREIKRQMPSTEVVIFSGRGTEATVEELFEAGAKSFISKNADLKLLVAAIKAAAAHEPFVTPEVSEILFARYMAKNSAEARSPMQLTARECEMIRHIADGESTKKIGVALGISTRTAENYRAAIMRKLGASSTAEIVRVAIRKGIIDP